MSREQHAGPHSAFHFTLIAAGRETVHDIPEDIVTKGLDDCTVASSEGRVELIFHREATTLNEAIGSAIVDLKKAGISAWLESVESPENAVHVA